MTAECSLCGEPAVERFGNGRLCEGCIPGESADISDEPTETDREDFFLDFSNESETQASVPPTIRARGSWMAGTKVDGRKQAHAPWSDHPATPYYHDDECERPERHPEWVWADPYNWADYATVSEWVDKHPGLDHRAFILQPEGDPYRLDGEADPFLFFDWDDVRDPETGDVIPEVPALLEQLTGGDCTYVGISDSGGGLHTPFEGQFPEGWPSSQAFIQLRDEPVFGHDDPPVLEIYEGPHAWWVTGDRVAEAPEEIAPVDEDGLEAAIEPATVAHPNRETATEERGVSARTSEQGATTAPPTPNVEGGPDGAEPVDPEVLDEAVAKAARTRAGRALAHIHPDVHYARWLRLGFALVDYFDEKAEAKVLYVAWSRGDLQAGDGTPAKWDHDAEAQAKRIIQEATDAGENDVTAGTLFELARQAGWEPTGGGESQHAIETGTPPAYEPEPFDSEAHWSHLQGERYERARTAGRPVIWADDAGSGKTTNAAIAAADREDDHALLFDKHEKAREFIRDDDTPEDYFHLKGAEQAREPHCMDADHADEDCPEHGHPRNCPRMCPVYDLPADHDDRQQFEAVMAEVGPVWAHILLEPHDGEECDYLDQLEAVRSVDRVVGVHEYLPLSTVTGDRQVIVDEKPRSLAREREFTVGQLTRAGNDLADQTGPSDAPARTLEHMGAFARRIVDIVTGAADAPETLADLEPPTVIWDTYESYNSAAGNYVETVAPEEPWHYAEALAQAKIRFNGTILSRMREDEWDGTPLCFDALLAAAIEAGLPREPLARAIAAPVTLADCPRCRHPTDDEQGARVCPECGWDERTDAITQPNAECARASVDLGGSTAEVALTYRELPLTSELPAAPLVLDATATPERIEGVFGAEAIVEGDTPREATLHVTQVLDGQYHFQTIHDAVDDERTLADRIQRAIDTAGEVHERPLFVLRAALIPEFEFPDHAEVEYYGGLRGLNYTDCDAVMCIGAPHPDITDLKRKAELLAQDREDLRVGGVEHSTRRDAPNPPVYRKLYHEDGSGDGRAVPTKHYTGLVGALFRETREKELDQALHRIRPLLANKRKHAYLLTNVPTAVPVDEVATFEELADPLEAMLPVPEGVVELLDVVREVAAGNGPDGFRAETLVDIEDGTLDEKVAGYHRLARLSGRDQLQVSERTVRNWVDALEDLGLLTRGEYEQHAGRPYAADLATLKSALSVLSGNTGFEVAAVRRFQALASRADGSLAWLKWAREALNLGGDRCEWIPPPERQHNEPG